MYFSKLRPRHVPLSFYHKKKGRLPKARRVTRPIFLAIDVNVI